DAELAAAELADAVEVLAAMGFAHPGALPILPDAVEALARSSEPARATVLLEELGRQAAAVEGRWAPAAFQRCRGVRLLAGGDAEAAAAVFEDAAARFDALGYRPGSARAVLGKGRALLRGGQRSLAAEALAEARARFAEMGAATWEATAA